MIIRKGRVELEDFISLLEDSSVLEIDADTITSVEASYTFLEAFASDKIIYGINTGFGPMAQYRVKDDERNELQYNLIRSHASGMGSPYPEKYCKAALLSRLNTLLLGYSGIHRSVVELMVVLLKKNITPVIYEHGGVGASGDLVQLAHLALALLGEGEVYVNGEVCDASKIFKEHGIEPMKIHIREGLAIMNGTSAMTGIGLINIHESKRMLSLSISFASVLNEILGTYEDHYSEVLNKTKLHSGQQKVAEIMRSRLESSHLIKQRSEHLYNGKLSDEVFKDKVQEYYSIRCVPQILGPILDTIESAEKILIAELNSANDNPIIDRESGNVYHGGNFHGDYVSLEMDKLRIAMTKLSMLLERQLNYLLNDKLNHILTPFLNLGKLGFNFGLQGMQFTAVSTVAENQTLSFPMYLHSIPNNNDNQDIVSMGCNAAWLTSKVIDNTYDVLSIYSTAIIYSVEQLKILDQLSSANQSLVSDLMKIVRLQVSDEPAYKNLKVLKHFLRIQMKYE